MTASPAAAAVMQSSLVTSLKRYQRSWGLWLLLLIAPVGARFMISDESGKGVAIAVNGQLPVLTSPVLGVWLGIVVTTLLLPAAYIYLRANTNRRQPWQVEEVTVASRMAIMLGRFAADCAVLLAALGALTLAGWFLGWLMVSGPLNLWQISYALWLVAAPAMIGLAAIRIVFDALPWLRGAFGDLCYFFIWMFSLVAPVMVAGQPSSLSSNMLDFGGFVRPLVGPQPAADANIIIGGAELKPGRIKLDAFAGLDAPGYAPSRLAWVGIAVVLVVLAGLAYRPHRPGNGRKRDGVMARLLSAGLPPAPVADAPPARMAAAPIAGLIWGEFRLIGAGRVFLLLATLAAAAGLAGDYRHIGSPLALLVLIFALCAHAGGSEARGLLALAGTAMLSPWLRRAAFVLAGTGWALLLAIPAALVRVSPEPALLALATGTAASLATIVLASLTGSSFAPRVVLLIAWYVYLSS